MSHRGFTLIEMLIVILIIAITSAIVAPVAYKSVEKFDKLLSMARQKSVVKKERFYSFLSDSECKLSKDYIICGNIKYAIK